MPPPRVPPGTRVITNDPSRRIVCSTVSARAGPLLDARSFTDVFVDEACMLSESCAWALLRADVESLTMAGDPRQLPAMSSQSGEGLFHGRSLMERLLAQGYPSHALTEQHRMAPALLAFPNAEFYGGTLRCGAHAPPRGEVILQRVSGGREAAVGTSWRNALEAAAIAEYVGTLPAADRAEAVVLVPYAAQAQAVLSKKLGVEVHTIDSFQGRQAPTVLLSLVRDGSAGFGFWEDDRRLVVALTRARTRLVVFASFKSASGALGRLVSGRKPARS